MMEQLAIHQEQRADVYKTLAACFCPPDEALLHMLNDPALGADTPAGALARAAAHSDLRALQVDHARLFVGPFKVLASPYGSVYLEGNAVMGESTADVAQWYRREGMEVADKQVPDHITAELEFVHVLILRETEAMDAGEMKAMWRYRQKQRSFLASHLGAWLAEFAQRSRQHAQTEFYRALADEAERFVLNDLQQLNCDEATRVRP